MEKSQESKTDKSPLQRLTAMLGEDVFFVPCEPSGRCASYQHCCSGRHCKLKRNPSFVCSGMVVRLLE